MRRVQRTARRVTNLLTRARHTHPPARARASAHTPAHTRISRLATAATHSALFPMLARRMGMAGDAGSACARVELNAALS